MINATEEIGVLTYNVPHRKTYDTLCLLKAKGYRNVTVFSTDLHYVKKFEPLIEHRPAISGKGELTPEYICKNFDYTYKYSGGGCDISLPEMSKILVCGAGIIPEDIVKKYRIINAHPGYIPNVRGLDALKWAIYEGQPIGVTTHLIGDEIDAGDIIERNIVPVFSTDTFHAVAQRQYEMEIRMLVDAICGVDGELFHCEGGAYPVHKRMPHLYEMRLMERFEQQKSKIPIEIEKE